MGYDRKKTTEQQLSKPKDDNDNKKKKAHKWIIFPFICGFFFVLWKRDIATLNPATNRFNHDFQIDAHQSVCRHSYRIIWTMLIEHI